MTDMHPALSGTTCAALLDAVHGFVRGVVVVCGFPAAGKSSASRLLATETSALVLDKDAFAPALEESVMAELTGNPHDRDSAIYRRVLGPHIYDTLVRNALRVGEHHTVIVDAPFID
ncbi:AAA family ATPase [Nocardia sp. IFM 10818]